MKPDHVGATSVRVRVTLPAAAWAAFEALAARWHPMSRESVFEMVLADGLRHWDEQADRFERALAVVRGDD